jgi:hypothetical protein
MRDATGEGVVTISERRKGLRGQQEVQRLFASLDIDLDKLAAQGDRVWRTSRVADIRLEVKRQERLQLKLWLTQAEAETPAGMIHCVAFRQTRGRWYACLPLEDLVRLVDG